ncbi:MAG: DnaA/Hda family protein [candidate division WOR-3 bacterium]|nr:DnaA/Hda family protein [candidate division WOR-3 bacterium]
MKTEQTFDSFYIYEGNRVAFSAAKKIVEFPGVVFNPLYIYGGRGLGKTHLLSAINLELTKTHTSYFLTAKQFETKFKNRGGLDAPLVVDDIHEIGDEYKKRLSEVLEQALRDNIQVCFSANALPQTISGFTPRICNMINGGLICELLPLEQKIRKDIIRIKADEAGIILSDEIVEELACIPVGSVGVIDNMVRRLVTYSSLGNLAIDANSIKFILKELFPQKKVSPIPSLLKETNRDDVWGLEDVEAPSVKEEYQRRISIWRKRGFDVSLLKKSSSKDTLELRRAYHDYVERVRRLIRLQNIFASIDRKKSPADAMKIEMRLFNPDSIVEIEKLLQVSGESERSNRKWRKFNEFILGFCNKLVWDAYHDKVLDKLGEYNPFVILGNSGTGKTHFLEAVCDDLLSRNISVMYHDLRSAGESGFPGSTVDHDVLLLDNFDAVFNASESFINDIGELLERFRGEGKQVIIASVHPSTGVGLPASLKGIFDEGKVVELEKPSADVISQYVRRKMPSDAEETFDDIFKEGIPEFESFYDIDYFLHGAGSDESGIVPLGLPGEGETVETETESTSDAAAEKVLKQAKSEVTVDIHDDDNYMVPEVRNELLMERF